MFIIDYQKSVFADYQRKKTENALSPRLIHPTPAKIRDECIAVCEERYEAKDEQVLRTFFGKKDDLAAYIQAIRKYEPDRFKPLLNYLRGQVDSPDETNIELLAWLIDFEPRPYNDRHRYVPANYELAPSSTEMEQRIKTEKPEVEEEDEQEVREKSKEIVEKRPEVPEEEPGGSEQPDGTRLGFGSLLGTPTPRDTDPPPEKRKRVLNIRLTITLIFSFLIIGAGVYWYQNRDQHPRMPLTGKESCMYWAGDHYQEVSCNQNLGDTLVLALDSTKLKSFRKITQPDTITGYSIGHVWYVKVEGGIEFYTADGFHPIYHLKKLKPLTSYIITTYIRPNN
ncbi:MAG TPA: hypothetical protein VM802_15110 [Chitinophaga sp.]|uniref:hypothetical protein n=1 Tax=Chitinophaga sp. TaxID=1869181 RepID=UPI002BD77054|nr:hypothetical protein [Chitinophaga sp.]HVI46203.1 hypothetical protein [Chitinophaga sp.]